MFNIYDKSQSSQLLKELAMLTSVDCEALVSMKGASYQEGRIGVILEYMDLGALDFILTEKIDLEEYILAAIVYQIIWGLGYLHYDNRLHRDIKPANVLLVCYFTLLSNFFLFYVY
jgi:serine/threonine protein kinase